ncbi:MAG: CD1871A family CXXC motif-containing protein [Oscillospiraceae bacterium]
MKRKTVQTGLIAVGAIMIVCGIVLGEAGTVFHKAILICLECIGIG